MRIRTSHGVYGILCIPTGKWLIGSGNAPKRLDAHRSKLRRGEHKAFPRLQNEWEIYGEAAFAFVVFVSPHTRAWEHEQHMIHALGTLEHERGFNKMVGNHWGPEASIRNSESKLIRASRFCYLPDTERQAPMDSGYIERFLRYQHE